MVRVRILGDAMTQDPIKMAKAIEDSFDYVFTMKHIRESNMIEGITREPTDAELHEWKRFLDLDIITVDDLKQFVYVYAGAGNRLRTMITDHHQIGSRKLEGGDHVFKNLWELLVEIHNDEIDPFHAHVEYEFLHPFTDGNGRSGRMLWHWMMKRKYGTNYHQWTSIGFLHRYYYQSIEYLGPL